MILLKGTSPTYLPTYLPRVCAVVVVAMIKSFQALKLEGLFNSLGGEKEREREGGMEEEEGI